MATSAGACVLTLPHLLSEPVYHEYQQELFQLTRDVQVVIDFQHITSADYHFLHSLLYLKQCLASCLNEITFVNYSSDVRELFAEINLKKFLGFSNLTH